ncbi:hypothetical protein [Absidia glauca]|uniref:Mitochondrial resolvase Ydc2 catalytic domain-containing protein n=1 Tax=Absidia glauca TaxID=4829 RepID=A0A163JIY3_ABSGL|nr:hypothetical protein [Absidia glauca]
MILQRLTAHLQTLKAAELQQVASACGVTMYGTKSVVTERLTTHFANLYDQAARRGSSIATLDDLLPPSVLSFDMGYRNLGFVQLSKDRHIKAWQVLDLELTNFHASAMVPIVRQFVHDRIRPLMVPHLHIVIEQQRARSASSHGIFEHTLRVNTVEALLWSTLSEIEPHCPMEPILRQPVDKLWQDDLDLTLHKKKASVALVKGWLEQGTVVCPDELVTMFMTAKKKDDLSDSLMQALAFYRWRENAIKYLVAFQ